MFRNSGYFFIGVFGLTLLAFWPSYVVKPGAFEPYTHFHAAVMMCWFGILIAQPFLMRAGKLSLHRAVGRLSFVLVPIIVVALMLLNHQRMRALADPTFDAEARFYFLAPGMTILIVLPWALAIVYRKTPALHARYMIATTLALVDPIVARILFFYFPRLPRPEYAQLVSLIVSVLVLVVVIVRERGQRSGRTAFPVMLGATVAVYGLFFAFAPSETWLEIARWYRALPLT